MKLKCKKAAEKSVTVTECAIVARASALITHKENIEQTVR